MGAFAWSAGLETSIVDGRVHDRTSTQDWVAGSLHHGGLRNDAILLAHAHRNFANPAQLAELADLCLALSPSGERHAETLQTGRAFILASAAWPSTAPAALPEACPYHIAVGAIAASHAVDLTSTLLAYLTATIHGQVSVAVRLVAIGQTDGLSIMASLEPEIAQIAELCLAATLDDIGSVAYGADIAQMKHETLATRIFRS
ncbi:urease accessory protein UreF [Devosia sp.]|uniref:urease accessory protein UreF n=1 Tax=Devosia sp. TaxID=1871048 RepID=UPI0025C1B694|nr:urease accessory UreF family protein [Devosia sp.]